MGGRRAAALTEAGEGATSDAMTARALTTPAARFDIAVVGGGPAGLAAALACARGGARTALVLRSGVQAEDLRTAALFPASVRLLDNLGVWRGLEAEAAPLRAIRILDDTSWLLKAPEIVFNADEIGETALATNVANAALVRALTAALGDCPTLTQFATTGTPRYSQAGREVVLALSDSVELSASLVVAADGRSSPLRNFAGITARERNLDQTALVATFSHSRPHNGVSTEIHRDAGPLTAVPLPGNRSSLVWVERPRQAERLAGLAELAFAAELQSRLHGLLGTVSGLGPRMSFPLQWLEVDQVARNRIALIGEAAHVLPPIGAQGLNLGLRDAADLAEVVLPAIAGRRDPGAIDVLAAYDRARRADTQSRSFTVDVLNRSLESGTLPLQLARGLGMFAMNLSPMLKRAVMQHGAGGLGLPPTLMRRAEILPPGRAAG